MGTVRRERNVCFIGILSRVGETFPVEELSSSRELDVTYGWRGSSANRILHDHQRDLFPSRVSWEESLQPYAMSVSAFSLLQILLTSGISIIGRGSVSHTVLGIEKRQDIVFLWSCIRFDTIAIREINNEELHRPQQRYHGYPFWVSFDNLVLLSLAIGNDWTILHR